MGIYCYLLRYITIWLVVELEDGNLVELCGGFSLFMLYCLKIYFFHCVMCCIVHMEGKIEPKKKVSSTVVIVTYCVC